VTETPEIVGESPDIVHDMTEIASEIAEMLNEMPEIVGDIAAMIGFSPLLQSPSNATVVPAYRERSWSWMAFYFIASIDAESGESHLLTLWLFRKRFEKQPFSSSC
jgi:hypothetical protein